MESPQERYFKNYQFEEIPDHSRKGYKRIYTYIGDYYSWDIPEKSLRNFRFRLVALEAVSIACFLCAALSNDVLNRSPVIAAPSCISIIAMIFEIIAVGFFCFASYPLKEEDYKRIHSTFYLTFRIRAICLLIAAIGSLVNAIRYGLGINTLPVIAGYLAAAIIAGFFHQSYKKLSGKMRCKVHDSSIPAPHPADGK